MRRLKLQKIEIWKTIGRKRNSEPDDFYSLLKTLRLSYLLTVLQEPNIDPIHCTNLSKNY